MRDYQTISTSNRSYKDHDSFSTKLGLMIAKQLVRAYGKIHAESNLANDLITALSLPASLLSLNEQEQGPELSAASVAAATTDQIWA